MKARDNLFFGWIHFLNTKYTHLPWRAVPGKVTKGFPFDCAQGKPLCAS